VKGFSAGKAALICGVLLFSAAVEAKKDRSRYTPVLSDKLGDLELTAQLLFGLRAEGVKSFSLDSSGRMPSGEIGTDLHLRLGVIADWRPLSGLALLGEYEQDVISSAFSGERDIEGLGMPYSREMAHAVRKASLRASIGDYVHLSGGLTTSHWGLGLVANDGSYGWAPGNALFSDPRGGDRVLRLMLASGPHTPLNIVGSVAFDWVREDDLLPMDDAKQIIAAIRVGVEQPFGADATFMHRFGGGDDEINLNVMDFNLWAGFTLDRHMQINVEGELAIISGTRTLQGFPASSEQTVTQLAGALRAGFHLRQMGIVVDFLYTSGDDNFSDDTQNDFKADPNYQISILLHRHVMAAQTGRGAARAADPNLLADPFGDVGEVPTRGSISNTIAIFPRAYYRLIGFEFYGGPLFAFAEVDNADPLNTRLNGGDARNALGGDPGTYLGTEVDIGVRYREVFWGSEIVLGLEGGVLFPGSAFRQLDGELMGAVWGGRVLLQYRM